MPDNDTDHLLEIPAFLIVTPERQRQIEQAARQAEAEDARRLAERRAASERAVAAYRAEKERRERLRLERKAERESRAERRKAKQAAYDRILGLPGFPFTVGGLEKKLGIERALILSAIRRGRKAGFIKKVSRRKYVVR